MYACSAADAAQKLFFPGLIQETVRLAWVKQANQAR